MRARNCIEKGFTIFSSLYGQLTKYKCLIHANELFSISQSSIPHATADLCPLHLNYYNFHHIFTPYIIQLHVKVGWSPYSGR